MTLLSPIKPSTRVKRRPEEEAKSPEKKNGADLEGEDQPEPTEEELMAIEDGAADLDARADCEAKRDIIDILSNKNFEKNHPIEVSNLIKPSRFMQCTIKKIPFRLET